MLDHVHREARVLIGGKSGAGRNKYGHEAGREAESSPVRPYRALTPDSQAEPEVDGEDRDCDGVCGEREWIALERRQDPVELDRRRELAGQQQARVEA